MYAGQRSQTQCLNVIFVKCAFDIFDHEACFSDCRVSDHSYFDDDTTPKGKQVSLNSQNRRSHKHSSCKEERSRVRRDLGTGKVEVPVFLGWTSLVALTHGCCSGRHDGSSPSILFTRVGLRGRVHQLGTRCAATRDGLIRPGKECGDAGVVFHNVSLRRDGGLWVVLLKWFN